MFRQLEAIRIFSVKVKMGVHIAFNAETVLGEVGGRSSNKHILSDRSLFEQSTHYITVLKNNSLLQLVDDSLFQPLPLPLGGYLRVLLRYPLEQAEVPVLRPFDGRRIRRHHHVSWNGGIGVSDGGVLLQVRLFRGRHHGGVPG